MFGSICGDVLGSFWEFNTTKDYGFPILTESATITDDTICTAAIASALLRGRPFAGELRSWYGASTRENFGPRFETWASSEEEGFGGSAGNGACMRVGAIAGLADDLPHALRLAAESACTSHHHPESVRAAMAAVAAHRLALEGWAQADMGRAIEDAFGYDLHTPLEDYRAIYRFEPLAEHTVGPSLRGVVEATSFEDGIRRIVSMGGDADTMAATAGGALAAYHPVPDDIAAFVRARLPRPVAEVLAAHDRAVAARGPAHVTPPVQAPDVMRAELARALERFSPRPRGVRRLALAIGGALRRRAA